MDLHCLLRTIRRVSEEIPDFEKLEEDWSWLGGEDLGHDLSDETRDLHRAFKKALNRWLHRTSEEEILETKGRLDTETLKVFRRLARPEYEGLWQPPNQDIPNRLCVPSPFFLVNRRQSKLTHGEMITTTRQYGKTKLTLSGPVLQFHDAQVMVAVIQFKNRIKLHMAKPIEVQYNKTRIPKTVVLRVENGLAGLAKEMNKSNPWSRSTQKAICNSLDRLVAFKFTLTTPSHVTIGHFLNRVDWDKDESKELVLQFDRQFLELYNEGFQQIKQLEAYYQLPNKAGLLFHYVNPQREFNQGGRLNAISIKKLCHISGLDGGNSDLENYKLVNRVREAAKELHERGMIGKYSVTDKKFVILKNKHKN